MPEPRLHWFLAGGPACSRASKTAARAGRLEDVTCRECRRQLEKPDTEGLGRAVRASRRAQREREREKFRKAIGMEPRRRTATDAEMQNPT